ncbi:putative integral membrane protein [Fimbriiglobus ruber]|uniref:Putative integral membrane protein n=1 Tax=Fimbriiglobus ruber TaxID=1908690 RepID=A0A225E0N8_9BACT|nr:putative integral membrane protein [Fimbriiglobus ruber]
MSIESAQEAKMKFPLGEMTVGDILDRGLKLLLARLPSFYLLNLIALTPVVIVQICAPLALAKDGILDQNAIFSMLGITFLGTLITLFLQPLATAAILHIVMEEYAGRRPTVGQALSFALTRFWSLVGALLLVGLIIVAGLVLCFVPGIYFAVTYAFVIQIVVLERLGVTQAMQRSKQLVSGYRWRVFGVLGLVQVAGGMFQNVVIQGLQIVLPSQRVIPTDGGFRLELNAQNHVIDTFATQLLAILFATFAAVCTTLLYLDLRIRKEGFDLALAAQLGEESSPPKRRDRYDDDRRDDDQHDYDDRRDDDRNPDAPRHGDR